MLDAGERGDRNPGAMLTAHELPPTLVEHGVVAQAQEHEIDRFGWPRHRLRPSRLWRFHPYRMSRKRAGPD
jgi:hypothetical protein